MILTSYQGTQWHFDPFENVVWRNGSKRNLSPKKSLKGVVVPFTVSSLINLNKSFMSQLVLDLTENCNMRCNYCPFSCSESGEHTRSDNRMSEQTICHAIDLFFNGSSRSSEPEICFFGGEPTLEFRSICFAYDYAMTKFQARQCTPSFLISTNGTLIDEDVLRWLEDRSNVNVAVTLNGPAEIHNRYRVFSHEMPTHQCIVENIRKLDSEIGAKRIHIQCNYANTVELLRQVKWFRAEALLSGISISYSKITPYHSLTKHDRVVEALDRAIEHKLRQKITLSPRSLKWLNNSPLWRNSLMPQLCDSMGRRLPSDVVGHYGVCSPLCGRCRVGVNGDLYFCEKTYRTPILGNVNKQGIDYEGVGKWQRELNKLFESLGCKDCPCVLYCELCYIHFLDRDGVRALESVHCSCARMRDQFVSDLSWYCSLCERDPQFSTSFASHKSVKNVKSIDLMKALQFSARYAVRAARVKHSKSSPSN